jgi:hypothetical protein
MSLHYTPKTFLREASNRLLKECFNGVLDNVDWESLPEHEIEVVYDKWQMLPESERVAIERRFEDAEELNSDPGIRALIDECSFHGVDIVTEWEREGLTSFRDRILWVALNHPRAFEVAGIINHAHALSLRYWRKRGNMPQRAPDVSPEAIERFREAISAFFRQAQGRGHRCTVDAYLRVQRYDYFFAYPDDYANTYLGHDELGQFVRRPQRPAFEVVFLYDRVDGTLDLYAQGGKEVQLALQTLFCRELMGQELPPEAPNSHPYELNGLKTRGFGFPTDPEDGVEDVRVRKLRLSVLGGHKRRIWLEADPDGAREDVYDMMEQYLDVRNLPSSLVNVTVATLSMKIAPLATEKGGTVTFDVSFPNSSNLKSEKRERLRDIAGKYLKRWGIDRA